MGSDVGPFPHGTQAREFVLMVKFGMSPLAAIQAGTVNGAKLLGWQDKIGGLKPGYAADIVAVPGNPLDDITALQKVSFVKTASSTASDASLFFSKRVKQIAILVFEEFLLAGDVTREYLVVLGRRSDRLRVAVGKPGLGWNSWALPGTS